MCPTQVGKGLRLAGQPRDALTLLTEQHAMCTREAGAEQQQAGLLASIGLCHLHLKEYEA